MANLLLTANHCRFLYAQFGGGFLPHGATALVKAERLRNIARVRGMSCIANDGDGWS